MGDLGERKTHCLRVSQELKHILGSSLSPTFLPPQRVYDLFQVKFPSSTSTLLCSGVCSLSLLIMVALLLRGGAMLLILLLWPAWLYSLSRSPRLATSLASHLRKSATTLKYSRTAIWLQLPSSTSSFPVLPPSISSWPSRVNPQCPPLSVNARRK